MVIAGTVKAGGPIWWIVGLLLMGVFGRALAQDNARHHGPIAQGRKGDRVAEDGWQRMAADTHRSHGQCLPPTIQVLHLPSRYLENTDHLEKGVNPWAQFLSSMTVQRLSNWSAKP